MTQAEAKAKIAELEEDYEEMKETAEDAQAELAARPSIEVEVFKEVLIENSHIGGENLGELFGALAVCQGEFESVVKGAKAHKYDYANLESVLAASTPITSKNGISVIQMNVSKVIGKTLFVGVKTILGHSGGGYVSSEICVPVSKTKMNTIVQMAGVSVTYLRRYGLQSALGLSTTDNDGSDK